VLEEGAAGGEIDDGAAAFAPGDFVDGEG